MVKSQEDLSVRLAPLSTGSYQLHFTLLVASASRGDFAGCCKLPSNKSSQNPGPARAAGGSGTLWRGCVTGIQMVGDMGDRASWHILSDKIWSGAGHFAKEPPGCEDLGPETDASSTWLFREVAGTQSLPGAALEVGLRGHQGCPMPLHCPLLLQKAAAGLCFSPGCSPCTSVFLILLRSE